MGIGVSGYRLARAVSAAGQLGVVSGTALDTVFARRLQLGDPSGDMRRAVESFPYPSIARRVWEQYFVPGGKPEGRPFALIPMPASPPPRSLVELTAVANFAEVFLAKEGHSGVVGINFLEKIQLPTLPSVYGAMLAGVDYVLMGAGIPRVIPGVLDIFASGLPASLRLDVAGAQRGDEFAVSFDPRAFCGEAPALKRPVFFAIVSSSTLAVTLARKSTGRVDGFVVEGPAAGGHNAPPRGPLQLDAGGEPVYAERDLPDLGRIRELGLPFWLAGSYGAPGKLAEALRLGAAGIQAGSAFAYCEESGIDPEWKRRVIARSRAGSINVFTDPVASPTGFPFKVVQVEGTISDPREYAARPRVCDLGYLRQAYRKADGTLGFRCPGEPVENYLRKGGAAADTPGRKCLCNGLMATIGLGQLQQGTTPERPLLTAGDDIAHVSRFLREGCDTYCAADVLRSILAA